METILDKFQRKTPFYPVEYERTILERFSRKGGGKETEKVEQGKFFANYYECYMYALMLGIRNNHKLPFDRVREGKKFIEFGAWKPESLRNYIFMILMTLSDIEFIDLEALDDTQTNKKANQLRDLMEGYAKGGFDIICAKMEDDPNFFGRDFSAVNLIKLN